MWNGNGAGERFEQLCMAEGCTRRPVVEARDTGALEGEQLRYLCDEHADQEGYCSHCGEHAGALNSSGLCAACIAEDEALFG